MAVDGFEVVTKRAEKKEVHAYNDVKGPRIA
jgi:hypothetical protein